MKLVVQELTIAAPTEVVYRGLDGRMAGAHEGGWRHYLDRLRRAAVGDDPGPDPFASVHPRRARGAAVTAGGDRFAELAEPLLATARGDPIDDDGPAVPAGG